MQTASGAGAGADQGGGRSAAAGDRQSHSRQNLALAMLECMPLPALIIAANGAVVFANPAAQDVFMRSQRLLEAGGLGQLVRADSVLAGLVARVFQNSETINARDIPIEGSGFGSFRADVLLARQEDGAGPVSVLLRPRQRDLRTGAQAVGEGGVRSMAAMGRTLAHEVKNPLAGIRGAAQLLRTGLNADDSALADLIVAEVDRISRLIDRMESFGIDVPVVFEPINVHELLERVAVMAENGFGVDVAIRRDFDPSLPDVSGDRDQLVQVFLNLVKNAAEAALNRGEEADVVISSAYRHGLRLRSGSATPRDLPIEVAFADNGPGIPPDIVDTLFEPFVTTKAGGSGLGLPLVRKIITAHGGMIDFESAPGRTVFRIRLPVGHNPIAKFPPTSG